MSNIITPHNCDYDVYRQEWNRAIQKYPSYIFYCNTHEDVEEAIIFAINNELSIRIRSNGHNYEGFSVDNNVVVIDVCNLNCMEIDYEKETVTIGAGITLGQLYNFVASKGYPFPGGICPTVGACGFTLGGGWGLSCRYLGLGCDSLVELKIIDYKGELIVANEKEHKDLFWACRGAGAGNFGVVVELTYKLPKKVEKLTSFTITCTSPSIETQVEFLDIWQHWVVTADFRCNMKCSLSNTSTNLVKIDCIGLFYGPPCDLDEVLKCFKAIPGCVITSQYIPFLNALTQFGSSYPSYSHFKSPGRFVDEYCTLEELTILVKFINGKRPNGSTGTFLNLYGLGGVVAKVKESATAFFYRNSKCIMAVESTWDANFNKAENVKWVDDCFKYVYTITNGSYVNFPCMPLPHYLTDYFGCHADRLQYIKPKYDPKNIFTYPQGIQKPKSYCCYLDDSISK